MFAISSADEVNGILNNWIDQWLTVSLACSPASVTNGTVNATTCAITCSAGYHVSWTSCAADQTNNGGGWGGWGWGGWAALCTLSSLICTNWIYTVKVWATCEWWQLNNACHWSGVDTWSTNTWATNPYNTIWWSIVGSPFSTELNDAYLYAYSIGITTMDNIRKANMTGNLLRAHMAKMMTNYAIKVLKKTINTWAACEFDDLSDQTAEIKMYIKLSCQLGLMGIDLQSFSPNAEVTRAQFGTVLSRALFGDTYNRWLPYYVNHLNALKAAQIMNIINNPETMKEIRGYVMLMMMRAAK